MPTTSTKVKGIKYGTLAQYLALSSHDADTLYFITDQGLLYRGTSIVVPVNVVRAAKQKIAEIAPNLPSDIRITEVVDNSSEILNTINSLKETILITFLVVMLVVFIFLGRWRATFIIVLSIPIALLGSLVYLFATGNTLNIISMSALSIAIGMVVDDAIVVLENISTHLERGEKPKEAAVHATSEVGISVIASTLTMLCVFLPLTMVSGMAGIMFKQLGWIVSIIMIISTTAALTLVPMLCSRMLKAGPKTGRLHRAVFDPIEKGLDGLSAWYSRIIAWAVTHRKTVIFGALAIFVGVLALLAPGLKTEVFPTMDGGRLSVSIELPVGTEQSVTGAFAKQIADRLESEIPEIKVLQYRYGQASSDNVIGSMQNNGSYVISMNVNIGSMENRKRSSSEIADIIRKDLRGIGQKVKDDPLFLCMMYFLCTGRKLGFTSSVDDMHLGTQTKGTSGRIHGYVSAADHNHLLSSEDGCILVFKGFHQIVSGQVLVCGKYTQCLFTGDTHESGKTCTGTDKYRLKALVLHQFVNGNRLSDDHVGFDLYSKALYIFHFLGYNLILGKTEFRNTVNQNTAGFVQCLKYGHIIAHPC